MKFFRTALESVFARNKAKVIDEPTHVVTEGVESVWSYHISKPERRARGLCGAQTMYTAIPVEHWKMQFGEHFPKRPTWCIKCEELYNVR